MVKKRKIRRKRKKSHTSIYVITAGKYFYIGKSNSPYRRLEAHKNKAINDIGTNHRKNQVFLKNLHKLRIKVIERPRMRHWRKREIYWIAYYRRKYGRNRVLNASDGGDGATGGGYKDNSFPLLTQLMVFVLFCAIFAIIFCNIS